MNTFALSVVAIDRIWFQGKAVSCTVRTTTGWRMFEARHEPFLAVLQPSELTIVGENGARRSIAIRDGLLRFSGNACVVLVSAGQAS